MALELTSDRNPESSTPSILATDHLGGHSTLHWLTIAAGRFPDCTTDSCTGMLAHSSLGLKATVCSSCTRTILVGATENSPELSTQGADPNEERCFHSRRACKSRAAKIEIIGTAIATLIPASTSPRRQFMTASLLWPALMPQPLAGVARQRRTTGSTRSAEHRRSSRTRLSDRSRRGTREPST